MVHPAGARSHKRWAQLRFSIVGPLLASPPVPGQLQAELARLAEKVWLHPTTGEPVRFAVSTIERWLYRTRAADDPVGSLRRKVRCDSGRQLTIGVELAATLRAQHAEHPSWSYKLHRDNLVVVARQHPQWGTGALLCQPRRRPCRHLNPQIRALEKASAEQPPLESAKGHPAFLKLDGGVQTGDGRERRISAGQTGSRRTEACRGHLQQIV